MEKDTVAEGEPAFALLRIVKVCESTVPVGISPNLSGLGVENESWSPNGVSPSDCAIVGNAVAITVESRFCMNIAQATISGTKIGREPLAGIGWYSRGHVPIATNR